MGHLHNEIDLHRFMLLDGGTGAELAGRGWSLGSCLECWGMEHREVVAGVHRDFINAGARAIVTCTFGANRFRLGAYGKADQVEAYNRQLAQIARQAAIASSTLVIGDIGPSGGRYETMAEDGFARVTEAFTEQARALIAAGVDLLLVETMISLGEAQAALRACLQALDLAGTKLPVAVSLVFGENMLTVDRSGPEVAYETLRDLGADAVGCNCTPTGERMIEIVSRYRACGDMPVIAKPSAGLPQVIDGVSHYPVGPDEFARLGKGLCEAGATWIGGCCGASPAHIRALADALSE